MPIYFLIIPILTVILTAENVGEFSLWTPLVGLASGVIGSLVTALIVIFRSNTDLNKRLVDQQDKYYQESKTLHEKYYGELSLLHKETTAIVKENTNVTRENTTAIREFKEILKK